MDLSGKVVIVTGAARGIGKAYCSALLEHGCKVCVSDVNENLGKSTVEEFVKTYLNDVIFVRCDVTSSEDFKGLFEKTIEAFGYVDILVNNAGMGNEHEWEKLIQINYTAVVRGIKLAFHYMGRNKGGRGGAVVNTASMTALIPADIAPVYTGSKCAVVGVTRSFGTDLYFRDSGVTVSALCPGPVDTEFIKAFPSNSEFQDKAIELRSRLTLSKPSRISEALILLLREEKNGAILKVDTDQLAYEEYPNISW